jgi:hypothetical protein
MPSASRPAWKSSPTTASPATAANRSPGSEAPDSDYAAEGFKWFNDREWDRTADLYKSGDLEEPVPATEIADRTDWYGFERWRAAGGSSWVVRFEVIEYLSGPLAQPASPAPEPASLAAQPASKPEPGPWTRSDLDEWRCPRCGAMSYTPKTQKTFMVQCQTCPGLVWMEQLFGVAA